MSVQPERPSFTSRRMATGSSTAILAAIVSGLIPKCKHTAKQDTELANEASSIKGIEQAASLPLYI